MGLKQTCILIGSKLYRIHFEIGEGDEEIETCEERADMGRRQEYSMYGGEDAEPNPESGSNGSGRNRSEYWYASMEADVAENKEMVMNNNKKITRIDERTAWMAKILTAFVLSIMAGVTVAVVTSWLP